jgi:hypothetical protein
MCGSCGDDREWVLVDADGADFFRIGEEMSAGTVIGWGLDGREVRLSADCRIVDVQYDLDEDELTLVFVHRHRQRICQSSVGSAA